MNRIAADGLRFRFAGRGKYAVPLQEIQAIFDRHCVSCHNESQIEKSKLSLTGEVARPASVKLIPAGQVDPKRAYTQSYVTITTSGNPDQTPWMTWWKPRSPNLSRAPSTRAVRAWAARESPRLVTQATARRYSGRCVRQGRNRRVGRWG